MANGAVAAFERVAEDQLGAEGRFSGEKTLIDSTSGNTGVAYSLFGAALGVKVALVMPSNVSNCLLYTSRCV